jgi:hypothetical protein
MARACASFVLRWRRLDSGRKRIKIEHIQSGESALVATLPEALD